MHYLGAKTRVLPSILAAVESVATPGEAVCDLFSGSGAVSAALAERWPVVAVDIQEYARVLGSALLHQQAVACETLFPLLSTDRTEELGERLTYSLTPLIELEEQLLQAAIDGRPEGLADLLEAGSLLTLQHDGPSTIPASVRLAYREAFSRLERNSLHESTVSTASRYFGGLFFGFQHAVELDILSAGIENFPADIRDVGRAALLSTASEITTSIGNQFAQPLRPRKRTGGVKRGFWTRLASVKQRSVGSVFRRTLDAVCRALPSACGGVAIRSDYSQFLESWSEPIGAFYVDPPYTRDHYSRFYHVLETLCLRDNPAVSMSNLYGGSRMSRGAYRLERHQSPFCIRSQAPHAFKELFKGCRMHNAPVVVSYSPAEGQDRTHPRVMNIEDIMTIARRYYSGVVVQQVQNVAHSKFNKAELRLSAPDIAEVLITCTV